MRRKTLAVIIFVSIVFATMGGCGGQGDDSLDGTWEISAESVKETNTDNPDFQLISRSLVFSGDLITIATTNDYKLDGVKYVR